MQSRSRRPERGPTGAHRQFRTFAESSFRRSRLRNPLRQRRTSPRGPARDRPNKGVRSRFRLRGVIRHTAQVVSLVTGYALVSRFGRDGDDQRAALLALGADAGRVYLDESLTGMRRPRPGLGEALAATR